MGLMYTKNMDERVIHQYMDEWIRHACMIAGAHETSGVHDFRRDKFKYDLTIKGNSKLDITPVLEENESTFARRQCGDEARVCELEPLSAEDVAP